MSSASSSRSWVSWPPRTQPRVPTEVIEERTDYALPKGHYGRGLLDQLAKSGEIEAASAPGAERRLWRLSALSADPVYRAAQRAVAYPEKPPGEARLSQR